MFWKMMAVAGFSVGIATAAMAQAPGGVGGSNPAAPTLAPDLGVGQHDSIGTDPGITNSTIDNNRSGNGGVDLYKGGNTINPGGVNPALQSSPSCGASRSDAMAASGNSFCPQ